MRGELSTLLRECLERGERHLTEIKALLATYRERLARVKQERATLQATAAKKGRQGGGNGLDTGTGEGTTPSVRIPV